MHPENNFYEVTQHRGITSWCGVISLAVFAISSVFLGTGVVLAMYGAWIAVHLAVVFTLFAAPIGLLAGFVGLMRPAAAAIVGCLGNLLLIGVVFVIMAAASGI